MPKVRRFSVSMRCSMSCSMSCSVSMMRLMCLLVAMLMVSSVSGRGVDNLGEETEVDPPWDDVINIALRQDTDTILCGRRPAVTSKRHVGDEPTDNADNSDQLDKLLASEYVTHGDVPWQVGLHAGLYLFCSGVIINEFWVMTTAECAEPYHIPRVTVVVGDHHHHINDAGEQIFRVEQVYIRGGYEAEWTNLDYNLALLKIRSRNGRGIRFNDYVQPICLPEVGESPAVGTQLTISGWGVERHMDIYPYGDAYPNILKKMDLPVFNHTACKRIYPAGRITDRMLCAGIPLVIGGACLHDQGDPATYKSGGMVTASTGKRQTSQIWTHAITDTSDLMVYEAGETAGDRELLEDFDGHST